MHSHPLAILFNYLLFTFHSHSLIVQSLSLSLHCFTSLKKNNHNYKMLLGKRPRPPIKRTTSMTGITVDLTNVESQEPSDIQNPMKDVYATVGPEGSLVHHQNMNGYNYDQSILAMVSPRNYSRRNSGDFVETPHFLRTCGLCKHHLAPGKDIYMYRGDTAFCSLECREQQMKQDERKEKYKVVASSKKENHHSSPPKESSKGSSKSETVAAA